MDVPGVIEFARNISGTTSGQISDAAALPFFNKAYRDFYNRIVSLDRNYFWDKWTTDVIDDQYEYALATPDTDTSTFGIGKPEKIRIKYATTDTKFTPVFITDWDMLTETPEWYAINQPKSSPIAILTDTNYFHIFPTPTETVEDSLILEGAKLPFDCAVDGTEADIIIPKEHHTTIAYIMREMFYDFKLLADGEVNNSEARAEREIIKSLKSMGVLTTSAIRGFTQRRSELE